MLLKDSYGCSWKEYEELISIIINRLYKQAKQPAQVYGIANGGLLLAMEIASAFGLKAQSINPNASCAIGTSLPYMIVDDIVDTGKTMENVLARSIGNPVIVALYMKGRAMNRQNMICGKVIADDHRWIVFPWEDRYVSPP